MLFKLTLIIQLAGLLQLGTAEHWTTSCKTPLNFLNLMSTKTDYNFYANKESDEFNMPGLYFFNLFLKGSPNKYLTKC